MLNFLLILAKTFFEAAIAMIKSCIELIPAILELKKFLSYMTPTGVLALYLGVPVFAVTAIIFILKLIIRWCKNKF